MLPDAFVTYVSDRTMNEHRANRETLEAGPNGSSAIIAGALLAFALIVNALRVDTGSKVALTFIGVGLLFIALGRVRPEMWWELPATRTQRGLLGDRGATWLYQIIGWAAVIAGAVFVGGGLLGAG